MPSIETASLEIETLSCRGNSTSYQEADSPITFLSDKLNAGFVSPPHSHPRGQLVCAITGDIAVNVEGKCWILSPTRVAWIAPNTEHSIECLSDTCIATLYLAPSVCRASLSESRLQSLSPLCREMILKLSSFTESYESDSPKARLILSIIDELQTLAVHPFLLPMPKDRRLLRVCERLRREPSCSAPIAMLAKEAALSSRHLMRLFIDETGMKFGVWRQQMRLMASLKYLAMGTPVIRTSQNVGYKSVAAFSSAFKRTFGIPPSEYFTE